MFQVSLREKSSGFAFIFVLILVVAFGVAGYFAYQNYQFKKDGKNIAQSTLTPTTQRLTSSLAPNSTVPIANSVTSWKTYTDKLVGFSLDYPESWEFVVEYPSEKSSVDPNGDFIYVGQFVIKNPENIITLTYGDGFGGADCGSKESYLEDGEMETFQIKNQSLEMCKFLHSASTSSSGLAYGWTNGYLHNPNAEASDKTGYLLDIDSNLDDLDKTEIPEILSTFEFAD